MRNAVAVVITLAVAVFLVGCAVDETTPRVIKAKEIILPGYVTVSAEIWVEVPPEVGKATLEFDQDQKVVYIRHSKGRALLPDFHSTWGRSQIVAIYHLVDQDGVEIDFYRRQAPSRK